MTATLQGRSLIAVDVGNSRIKLGRFVTESVDGLPAPRETLSLEDDWSSRDLESWIENNPGSPWCIASVNRTSLDRLIELLERHQLSVGLLSYKQLPLQIDVFAPEAVGIDRLVDAVAANALREPSRPAVVVDVGSAITVNLVSAAGSFLGGAILPGIAMSARALNQFTDRLPLIPASELAHTTAALGKTTDQAMRAGLFWGVVGGIREVIARYAEIAERPQVFLTGGAAPAVAELLVDDRDDPARYVAHLTLAGIALAAHGQPR